MNPHYHFDLMVECPDGTRRRAAFRIDSDRKRLAQQIAEQLTKTILDAVQSRDLVNGYPKE